MEVRHRRSPMRHRTVWIKPGHILKGTVGCGVSEGVKQSHTPVELLLNGWRAGDGEGYRSELCGRIMAVRLLRCCEGNQDKHGEQCSPSIGHASTPNRRVALCIMLHGMNAVALGRNRNSASRFTSD